MRNRSKLVLAVLAATFVLGIGTSASSARAIEVLNWEKGFRIVWNPLAFSGAGKTIRCPVTLEGTFHRHTFAKVARTLLGYITRAIVKGELPPCTGGRARILAESLPWHVQYSSFAGTLPAITRITLRLVGAAFSIRPNSFPEVTCLARTSDTEPAIGNAIVSSGEIRTLEAEAGARIGLTGEGGICEFAGEGGFSGNGTATILGETAPIRIRLIT